MRFWLVDLKPQYKIKIHLIEAQIQFQNFNNKNEHKFFYEIYSLFNLLHTMPWIIKMWKNWVYELSQLRCHPEISFCLHLCLEWLIDLYFNYFNKNYNGPKIFENKSCYYHIEPLLHEGKCSTCILTI